jgi:hypothetical protein
MTIRDKVSPFAAVGWPALALLALLGAGCTPSFSVKTTVTNTNTQPSASDSASTTSGAAAAADDAAQVSASSAAEAASDAASPPVASGAVYYVSPSGDDSSSGAMSQPWRTIQHAADELEAGETVYIRAGTYKEIVRPQNDGQAGKPITYAAYPGEQPVIDGDGLTLPEDQAGLFWVADRKFIKVSGLKVMNARTDINSNGILVDRSEDITVEKCVTYNTRSSGVGVWSSRNIVVDGNDIELAGAGGYQESLSVAVTDNFEVKNNILRGGGDKEGICVKDGSKNGRVHGNEVYGTPKIGIYIDAWDKPTRDIWVYQNIVHGITNSAGIATASEMGGLLQNVWINNNVVYGNKFYGILISRNGDEGGPHPAKDIRVINNTMYGNGDEWGGCIAMDNPEASGVVIRNNICAESRSFELSVSNDVPTGAVTVENNLIHAYKGDLEDGEVKGNSVIEGDPLFADVSGHDFRLKSGSPAIDRGSSVDAPKSDYDGRSRPQGSAVDIGAFEY